MVRTAFDDESTSTDCPQRHIFFSAALSLMQRGCRMSEGNEEKGSLNEAHLPSMS